MKRRFQSSRRAPMKRSPERAQAALAHSCTKSSCGRQPHEPCRDVNGRDMEWPHSIRYGVANAARL